jgi:hypothetical protein
MPAIAEANTGAEKPPAEEAYASLSRLRRQFQDYLSSKQPEIDEQREARLYYHASQWTSSQLKTLKDRGQPPTTTPIFARKVNGFVGLLERLRQDPKAYPRTPKEEEGAELCTAALRYALDEQNWPMKSMMVSMHAAVDAIGGVTIGLTPGDSGQPNDFDVEVDYVETETFFYDPRSFRPDFSDARYMGVSKWMDLEDAQAAFPDKAEELKSLGDGSGEFEIPSDRENKWFNSTLRQVRVVEHWYKRGERWFWCIYTGAMKLDEGPAYIQDEKRRDVCRFIMWRAFVDQDGDAYSFHRNMKSLVDEINQRKSKALHLLAMRRIKLERGAVEDVEKLRKEAVRPDGVIEFNKGFELDFEDAKNLADMNGQLEMLNRAESSLENFGPNPALVGQGVEAKSGKAIQLLQQAGLSELGPFNAGNKDWKFRVYRAVWCAQRQHWTAERWIRVTDSEGQAQPVQINGMQTDPMTGQQQIVNRIGALDVDIIIDEGPDTVTMMADALETLQGAMANGTPVPAEAIFELLPITDSIKKKLIGITQQSKQPSPAQQQAGQIELAQNAANVEETKSKTALNMANAMKAQQPEQPQQGQPGPSQAELIDTLASAENNRAGAELKYAQAEKTQVETMLLPHQMAQKAASDQARVSAMNARQSGTPFSGS